MSYEVCRLMVAKEKLTNNCIFSQTDKGELNIVVLVVLLFCVHGKHL